LRFRSNAHAELPPLASSLLWHLGAAAFAGALIFFSTARRSEEVQIEVLDAPRASPAAIEQKPLAPVPQRRSEPRRRGVFGVTRRSLVAEEGEDVKAGNTVAKEVDTTQLRPGDEESLPIPADEFLVTAMPELASEVRVPYPREAREKKVQGAVVMEILIDAQGVVREAILVSGPGAGLDEAALEAVRSFRFRPARIEERPVAVRIRYAYRFVLEK
jgi:protein TonB